MYELKRIYDAHVHYRPISDSFDENIQNIQDFLGFSTIAGINILLLRERLNTLGDDAPCLYAKALYPEKVSVFNGLAIGYSTIPVDSEGLVNQVKELIEAEEAWLALCLEFQHLFLNKKGAGRGF